MKYNTLLLLTILSLSLHAQERVEYLPYGKMDTWTVRYIKESFLLGGKTRTQRRRAANLLSSGAEYFEREIPGQLSEVADGDAPHRSGGCPAQAWSVTELFRVRQILHKP